MRRAIRFLRHVMVLVMIAGLVVAGRAGIADASVSATSADTSVSANSSARGVLGGPAAEAAALAARRALVRRETSAAVEQATGRAIGAKIGGRSAKLPVTQARALAGRARVNSAHHLSSSRESATRGAVVASSGDEGIPEFIWLTGTSGALGTCQIACTVPSVVAPGELTTANAEIFNFTDPPVSEPVSVTFAESCGASGTTMLGTQIVNAPSIFSGTPGAVASVQFSVQDSCPSEDGTAGFVVDASATPVSGGTTGTASINTFWVDVPPSQVMACDCAPNSASPGPAQAVGGDPVNTVSGALEATVTDASLSSPGYPLVISRSYSSADTAAGALGPGWSLPWQAGLSVNSSGATVMFTAENGDKYMYTANGSGFSPPPGARSVLAAVTDSSGAVSGYTLTTLRHEVLSFDASGRLISEDDSTGRGLVFAYNASGQVSSITDAAGRVVTLTYDGSLLTSTGLPGNKTISYAYTNGSLASVTDPAGNTTTYTYSPAGLLASIKDPDGNTATVTYNSAGQVTAQTDAAGATTHLSYTTVNGLDETDITSPDGGITSYLYGGGMLLETVNPVNGTTKSVYNDFLEPVQVTGPLGNTTTMTYDGGGYMLTETDPLGHERQWGYSNGNITSYTDQDGNVTVLGYNSMDEIASITSPSGHEQTFGYDPAGNLTTSVDPRGSAATTSYTYSGSGLLDSVTNPDGDTTSYTYDPLGYALTVTDPTGHKTSYGYDADEHLTSVTTPDGGVTSYGFDAAGNLTSRTDGDGHRWTYSYDADNRMVKAADPLGGSVSFGYDGNGNQITRLDAGGATTTTGYDAGNRPVKVTYSDSTPTVSYSYDADSDITGIGDATGNRTLSYNADGELTSIAGPGSRSFSYTYGAAGHVTSRTYPDGTAVSYIYNSDQQLSSMTSGSATTSYSYDPAGNLTTTAEPDGVTETRTYDNAGQLTAIKDAASSKTLDAYSLTLNSDGQPVQSAVTQNGTVQPTRYYSYDPSGRLQTACSNTTQSACSTTSGGGEIAWTYDAAGNISTQMTGGSTTSYTYNAAEELTKATTGTATTSYSYDADGDQTKAGSSSFGWDAAGQMTQAVTAAGTYTYTYDSGGNLSAIRKSGTLQQTAVWDINNPLPDLAEQTGSTGTTTGDYLYQPDGALASMTASGKTYYATTDWLGSVTGLTTGSALGGAPSQVTTTTYSPYGAATSSGSPASPIGYAGSYTQPGSTGLDDMRARDYNPATGSFTSVDPLLYVTGEPYGYADDNPALYVDPAGLCPSDLGWECAFENWTSQHAGQISTVAGGIGLIALAVGCVVCDTIGIATDLVGTALNIYSTYQDWRNCNYKGLAFDIPGDIFGVIGFGGDLGAWFTATGEGEHAAENEANFPWALTGGVFDAGSFANGAIGWYVGWKDPSS